MPPVYNGSYVYLFGGRGLDNLFYFITKQQQKDVINGILTERPVRVISNVSKFYKTQYEKNKSLNSI